METSGISTSLGATSYSSTVIKADIESSQKSSETMKLKEHNEAHYRASRGRALSAFRQEMKVSLKAEFHAKFSITQKSYAGVQGPAEPDDVAAETLGVAKQVVAQSPTNAVASLMALRARVQQSVNTVQAAVADPAELKDVDEAVAKVDAGLVKLEDEAANTRESSTTVLDVDMRRKQQSKIRIRTQEGDVVKLSLRRVDKLSASDVSETNGETSTSRTEVEVSSKSRMMLKVDGDLNEAELAAIQNVFAQAEQIADEFFGGDIGAAFNMVQGFEFDSEQLSKVNMRFKMREVSRVAYSETRTTTGPAVEAPRAPQPESAPSAIVAPSAPVARTSSAPAAEPVAVALPVEEPVTQEPLAPEAETVDTAALSRFFESVGTFLRSVSEGFSVENGGASFKYQYSESFKLSLLQSVINVAAPDQSSDAATNANTVIERINAAQLTANAQADS
jgi:hypothetical protein